MLNAIPDIYLKHKIEACCGILHPPLLESALLLSGELESG